MEITARHNRKTYDFLLKTLVFVNILYGGAGSGKSWSIAQFLLLEKMYSEKKIRILVIRKTLPANRKSCWKLMLDMIADYGLPYTAMNKTELIIYANGNEMIFCSLDDVEKLKSIERINYIWVEEATEISKKEFIQLKLRCRGKNINGRNAMYLSLNPVDMMSFLRPMTENPPEGVAIHHSTYKDNEFLDEQAIKTIENLINEDKEYDTIYRKGEWATPTNIIYSRWDINDKCERYDDIYWGLDFGYSSHPTALVEIKVNGSNEIWERECLYETKLTNPELIDRLKDIIENRNQMIIADCAEPKSIQEIRNAGFNIHPCKKGKDSVRFGIKAVRSVMTHITPDSTNLIKEKRSYKWKVDKDDNVLNEPVKLFDHLMDAERYVLMKIKGNINAGFTMLDDEPEEKEDFTDTTQSDIIAARYPKESESEQETIETDSTEDIMEREAAWME